MTGYHLAEIPRGVLGEASKIAEECAELMDAVAQNSKVMALVELSDLVGAIEAYLLIEHPNVSLEDLQAFSQITARAFRSGRRESGPVASRVK
jgi:phosphoribosyl-ATP pyrophosphohydrolase